MKCNKCGKEEELRLGFCFGCATTGEGNAANRTVLQHISKAYSNIKIKRFDYAKYDLSWAWQRLTRTGDYEYGGYFDSEGHDWR